MGEVYRGRDSRLGRDVALKVLPTAVPQDSDRLRRFELEARATGSLALTPDVRSYAYQYVRVLASDLYFMTQ